MSLKENDIQFLKSSVTIQKVLQLITKFIGSMSFVTSVNSKTGVVVLDKTDIGLENVDNTSDIDKPISSNMQDALDLKIDLTEKGAINGIAPLNGSSKIDSAYLPAYVDDVLEFANLAAFPITGSTGIIYIAIDTNKTYRWSGSIYVEISQDDPNNLKTADIGVLVQPYDAETMLLDIPQQHTAQHNPLAFELSVVNGKIAWDLNEAQFAKVTITSDTTLLPATNAQDGGRYRLIVTASGGAQLKFGGDDFYSFTSNSIITQDGIQKFLFDYNGMKMLGDIPANVYVSANPIPALAPASWYNAKDYVGSPSNITTINDQGSNNFNGTKNGTGNIILSPSNGIDGLDFGSANNNKTFSLGLIPVSDIMSDGDMTIIAVVKPGNAVNNSQMIFGYGTNFDNLLFSFNPSNGNVEGFLFKGIGTPPIGSTVVNGVSASIAAGKSTVLSWEKNAAGDSYLRENKVQININGQTQLQSLVGTATQSGIGGFSVGGYIPMSGILLELLIFPSILSNTDRESVEQWLMNKFSI
jgi:hypothetical protein